MHEMGIAMQVIEIAKASIPKDMQGAKIERINLKIGKLSAVVSDSLTFCFDIIIKDEPLLSGAKLNIKEIPVTARCKECNLEWEIEQPVFSCRDCNSGSVDLISGQELDIDTIEIEE